MVFRKAPFQFGYRSVKKKSSRWMVNELPTTPSDKIYPQLPFLLRSKPYRIKNRFDKTLPGQLYGLTFGVTDLFRDERVVMNYNRATEIRPYAERLIVEAMRNGDRHKPTMDLANYWLREKNLIHKLFKVFVPRYENYSSSFTAIHPLGKDMNSNLTPPRDEAVIEMRGNQLPPITRPKIQRSTLLTNILIDGARKQSAVQVSSK